MRLHTALIWTGVALGALCGLCAVFFRGPIGALFAIPGAFMGFVTAILFEDLLIKKIYARTAFFTDSGNVAWSTEENFYLWRFGKLWRSLKKYRMTSFYPEYGRATVTIHAITANPEVRSVVCEATVATGGTLADLLLFERSPWYPKPKVRLQYLLYEFDERMHGRLAQFYNPADRNQQEAYRDLIGEFLHPYLEGTGVQLNSASFARPN
jgi:hypothetical protein